MSITLIPTLNDSVPLDFQIRICPQYLILVIKEPFKIGFRVSGSVTDKQIFWYTLAFLTRSSWMKGFWMNGVLTNESSSYSTYSILTEDTFVSSDQKLGEILSWPVCSPSVTLSCLVHQNISKTTRPTSPACPHPYLTPEFDQEFYIQFWILLTLQPHWKPRVYCPYSVTFDPNAIKFGIYVVSSTTQQHVPVFTVFGFSPPAWPWNSHTVLFSKKYFCLYEQH